MPVDTYPAMRQLGAILAGTASSGIGPSPSQRPAQAGQVMRILGVVPSIAPLDDISLQTGVRRRGGPGCTLGKAGRRRCRDGGKTYGEEKVWGTFVFDTDWTQSTD